MPHVLEADEQAAQSGVVTSGTVDLFVQANRELVRREAPVRTRRSAS
jgi:hypothetical protein